MPKYRLTWEGFRVHKQTNDHAFNVDGWGDEVYLDVKGQIIDGENQKVLVNFGRQTPVMGDIRGFEGQRIKGGTASRNGGFKSGDPMPYDPPYVRQAELQGDRLPMLLFEGELSPQLAIVFIPSVWEFDGGGDLFNTWGRVYAENWGAIVSGAASIITAIAAKDPQSLALSDSVKKVSDVLPAVFNIVSKVVGQAGDRPVGMKNKTPEGFTLEAYQVLLNSTVADFLSSIKLVGTESGLIPITFQDHAELGNARYEIYLKVEKLESPPPPSTENTKPWIRCLYLDLLGREPDEGGLNYYFDLLNKGTAKESVVDNIMRSQEYCSIIVNSFYNIYLERQSDPGGAQYWINILNNGTSFQVVIQSFCDSEEYKSKFPVPDQFTISLYNKLLGRAPEPGAVENNPIRSGLSTHEYIRQFLTSAEYASNVITGYYRKYLGRNPEPGAVEGGIPRFQNEYLQQIIRGFLVSDEYRQRSLSR